MTRKLIAGLIAAVAFPVAAADWTQYRGPNRDGRSPDKAPTEWSKTEHVKWKVKLPHKGNSSPIVVGDRVLVTCAEDPAGAGRSLYCFDRATGNKLWVQTVKYEQKEPTHATNPYCAPTPATDGKVVVVYHGSAGVHCYDLAGKPVWSYETGPMRHIWGYAASPVILGQTVFVNRGPGAGHYVVALNLADGKEVWKTPEPRSADDKFAETGKWAGSWTTPTVVKINGQEQLLIFQPGQVNAYDPANGTILWSAQGAGDLAYSDVMVAPEMNVGMALAGYGGAGVGFSLGGSPDAPAGKPLWKTKQNPQRIGSGVVVDKHLYLPTDPGIQCIDLASGELNWMQKFPGNNFWASIVSAEGRLYATSQKGTTYVFAPDPKEFKLLHTNNLGEHINATPAISNGQMFIRTWDSLYCIE